MKWILGMVTVICVLAFGMAVKSNERVQTNETFMKTLAIDGEVVAAVNILNTRIKMLEERQLRAEQIIDRLVRVSSIRDTFFTDALRDEMGGKDFNKFLKKWEALQQSRTDAQKLEDK